MFILSSDLSNPNVRTLFAPFEDLHLIVRTALEGTSPAQLYVDDADSPRSAVLKTPEGWYLTGDTTNTAFNIGLHDRMVEEMAAGQNFYFTCHPDDGWGRVTTALFPDQTPFVDTRYVYQIEQLSFDWRAAKPAEFELRPVDAALLAGPSQRNLDSLHEWITKNWGTPEAFLAGGFGFVLMHGDQMVSWSLCDCASGDRCEIGIETDEDFRRQGLASITTAAMVEHALTHGYRQVGWHCWTHNLGSVGVAERVGFQRVDTLHRMHGLISDLAMHYAVLGNILLLEGSPRAAAHCYQTALKQADAPPWVLFQLARTSALLGESEQALKELNASIDAGFRNPGFTRATEEFTPLRSLPGWDALLARMEEDE